MNRAAHHVLLVTGEYPPRIGGVGDHALKLRSALESLGLVCEVVTESRSNDSERESVRSLTTRFLFQSVIGALRIVRQIRPDVLHVQFQAGAFARPGELLAIAFLARVFLVFGPTFFAFGTFFMIVYIITLHL